MAKCDVMSVQPSRKGHDRDFDRLYKELVEAWMHHDSIREQDVDPDVIADAWMRLLRARMAMRQWHDRWGE